MISLRPFARLGTFENDWLNAHYHFSFSDYHDPARMGWSVLRVWNDDTIRAGTGFPPHGHRDMEIVTYIRTGAITHEDGLGNRGRTVAGDVQVMSAGKGITHAEFNLESEDTTLFQIWILPKSGGIAPRWETKRFPERQTLTSPTLTPLASGLPEHAGQALSIHQDAAILGATLTAGDQVTHHLGSRRAYLVVARGRLRVNGAELGPRDGAAIEGEEDLRIEALEECELVLADLP